MNIGDPTKEITVRPNLEPLFTPSYFPTSPERENVPVEHPVETPVEEPQHA